ncbi:ribbon-helix-helix protein, CopG family [Arthrobacter sp. ISL-85]|uniref:ribbon-helix-helix protein, CopG family n=1 Tax=Arthrobacter sp. ISL-85 TaxID=2819115 RepID=UPI001BE5758D|nr:ribbon-helix-helix protein, CopG family [Arthrobacter sp. ISL-85]MBT2568905.1 ribbon-helix-helix protein, CopG family [Arthrobacter sp. ISL-85]
MDKNLRVPEDVDRRLDQLAAEEHTSKSALLLQGAELVLQRHRRSHEIGEGLGFVMSHDAELLTRLEDARPRTLRLRTRCRSLTGAGMPVPHSGAVGLPRLANTSSWFRAAGTT